MKNARNIGILERHAEHLVVDSLVVLHPEQRDRLDRDDAARKGRLGDADHRVERVAVLAERVGNEAVVRGIDHRREQEAVELDRARLVVVLVLVAAALRDLHETQQLFVHAGHGEHYPLPAGPVRSRP